MLINTGIKQEGIYESTFSYLFHWMYPVIQRCVPCLHKKIGKMKNCYVPTYVTFKRINELYMFVYLSFVV